MKKRLFLFVLAALALTALGVPAIVRAEPGLLGYYYQVNTLVDNDTMDDGLCTLREAIDSSNGFQTDCGPGSGAKDTIGFAVNGTIVLGSALAPINDNVDIDGGGHTVAISGNNSLNILTVNAGKTLTLKNLTLAYGNKALANNGIANLTNVTLANNVAGSLDNQGTATVTNSTVANNGSANYSLGTVWNAGTLVITNSTFVNNDLTFHKALGGAIYNSGTLTVSSSTFALNDVGNRGGAIAQASGTATISNSTFSQNSAGYDGGAILAYQGTLNLINDTFSQNSAGSSGATIEFYQGSVTLRNTLILGGASVASCHIFSTAMTDGGHNLSYPGTSCPGIHQDPKLDPAGLKSNGGSTRTILPMPGSPAIDGGDNTTCQLAPVNNLDQRGAARPVDGNGDASALCDIGSVEAAKPAKPALISPLDKATVTSTRPTLTWDPANWTDTYRVTVKDAAGTRVDGKKGLTVTHYKTTTVLVKGKTYKWLVQACNTYGCTKSEARKFTVE